VRSPWAWPCGQRPRPRERNPGRRRHRFVGIAVTARYVPTQRPPAGKRPTAEYDAWASDWYGKLSPEPFQELLRPGSALVLDDAERMDVGSIGSNNILARKLRGLVGVVTNATARDTDEIETEAVPLYFRRPGRGIRPGRNEIESVNRPVVCGGVLVVPGDGVLVVPRAHAEEVARYARKIIEGDKAGRREPYKKLGLPPDPSIH
jgi:4-hydroxy-4-methyl-2-oxoglutarate aldolase